MKVKWKRHKSAAALTKIFLKGVGFSSELGLSLSNGDELSFEEYTELVEEEGRWAFIETKAHPPVVHYWHNPKRCTAADLMFMLGHELGHVSGKKLAGHAEERRADEYGDVAATVLRRLQKEGLVK